MGRWASDAVIMQPLSLLGQGDYFSIWGVFDPSLICVENFHSMFKIQFLEPCIFFHSISFPLDQIEAVFRGTMMF